MRARVIEKKVRAGSTVRIFVDHTPKCGHARFEVWSRDWAQEGDWAPYLPEAALGVVSDKPLMLTPIAGFVNENKPSWHCEFEVIESQRFAIVQNLDGKEQCKIKPRMKINGPVHKAIRQFVEGLKRFFSRHNEASQLHP